MAVKFVDEHRARWPVRAMCATIELAERTYYAAKARPRSARSVSDEAHVASMRAVWSENYSCYGATRLWGELNRQDHRVARCTVERLMPVAGLRGVQRGKKKYTTIVDDAAPRPADLVARTFKAVRPNALWVADITYASTWEGWLYVAFILDVFSRYITGWQISTSLETQLVLDALEMAIWRRDLTTGRLIHHSDRGCQPRIKRSSQHFVVMQIVGVRRVLRRVSSSRGSCAVVCRG
jgi:putative transposase